MLFLTEVEGTLSVCVTASFGYDIHPKDQASHVPTEVVANADRL